MGKRGKSNNPGDHEEHMRRKFEKEQRKRQQATDTGKDYDESEEDAKTELPRPEDFLNMGAPIWILSTGSHSLYFRAFDIAQTVWVVFSIYLLSSMCDNTRDCRRTELFSTFVWILATVFHAVAVIGMFKPPIASALCFSCLYALAGAHAQVLVFVGLSGNWPSEVHSRTLAPSARWGTFLTCVLPAIVTMLYVLRRGRHIRVAMHERRYEMSNLQQRCNSLYQFTAGIPVFGLWAATLRASDAAGSDVTEWPGLGTWMWASYAGALVVWGALLLTVERLLGPIMWLQLDRVGVAFRNRGGEMEPIILL